MTDEELDQMALHVWYKNQRHGFVPVEKTHWSLRDRIARLNMESLNEKERQYQARHNEPAALRELKPPQDRWLDEL